MTSRFAEVLENTLAELESGRGVALIDAREGEGSPVFRRAFPGRHHVMESTDVDQALELAVKLAGEGSRPVVVAEPSSLQRALPRLAREVCVAKLPVTIAVDRAGCLGGGSWEESALDLAWLRPLPNLKLLAPSSAPEVARHVRAALTEDGPVAIRFPHALAAAEDWGAAPQAVFGKARLLRAGKNAAIVVLGAMVPVALETARILSERGLELEIVEARSVKPLDERILHSVALRHRLIVTVEDHAAIGGLGSGVAEVLGARRSHTRLALFGWPDEFMLPRVTDDLLAACRLDAPGLADRIERLLHGDKKRRPTPIHKALEVDYDKAFRFIEEIKGIEHGETIRDAVREYEEVGERNSFLWKWVRRGVEITTLSCVDEALWDHVCQTKTLGVLFDVLVDDVADAESDSQFLEKLIAITDDRPVAIEGLSEEQQAYFRFTKKIWRQIQERVRSYPRHDKYEDILAYDYKQLMNSMRYSVLIKHHPAMMNVPEHDAYLPHNMHMIASGTIDIMASPGFDARELGRLRKVLLYAQYMGRIGNLVTTWEREIREEDFSSGVFPLGLALGVLSVDELSGKNFEEIARKIRDSDIEARFLHRWQQLRAKMLDAARDFESVDVGKLVHGLETLIQLHLGSRGLK